MNYEILEQQSVKREEMEREQQEEKCEKESCTFLIFFSLSLSPLDTSEKTAEGKGITCLSGNRKNERERSQVTEVKESEVTETDRKGFPVFL